MQFKKYLVRFLVATALASGFSVAAQAQIGTGWTSTSVSFNLHISSGCSVSGSTFNIDGGSGRAERRYTSFTSGQRQFQGSVRVNSLGGDRVSLKQTYSETGGPRNMIAVKKPGSLYEVQGGATLSSYSIGSTVRINTIANANNGTAQVYINGSLRETVSGLSDPVYDKLGAYATSSGAGPASSTWSSIQFWRK
jgi:hypothetical protein